MNGKSASDDRPCLLVLMGATADGAKELIAIQREARRRGEDIVGFYHSHPDHPPMWSQTDLAEAHWIGCSYSITSVAGGKADVTNSFFLAGDDESSKRLVQEPVEVLSVPRVETGATA